MFEVEWGSARLFETVCNSANVCKAAYDSVRRFAPICEKVFRGFKERIRKVRRCEAV